MIRYDEQQIHVKKDAALTLKDFFTNNPKIALAFSGGVDSSYLLHAAIKQGAQVRAYYVKTPFQPAFELDDALRLAKLLKADLSVLSLDLLKDQNIVTNSNDRCYYCKHKMFTAILQAAEADGFPLTIDGTNASDDEADRPGMRALKELSIRSPLRECGLSKADVRRFSKEAGLFTWNKPAYACLATRICTGEEITSEKLLKTETAEDFLFSIGFSDFRLRQSGNSAKLQIKEEQFPMLLERRSKIVTELKKYFSEVSLDLEVRHE